MAQKKQVNDWELLKQAIPTLGLLEGATRGLYNNVQGTAQLYLNPVGTGQGLLAAGKAVATDPMGTAKRGLLAAKQRVGEAMQSPEGFGQFVGENLSPRMLYTGLLGAAVPKSDIFAGQYAKGADKAALRTAKKLEKLGATEDAIWEQTGWMRAPDKEWKFEIDDRGAGARAFGPIDVPGGDTLPAVFDHNKAYQAYPSLKDIYVTWGKAKADDANGWYNKVGPYETIDLPPGVAKEKIRSTALHEMQHAIQERENFARGGSPQLFPDVTRDKAMLTDANVLWRMAQAEGYGPREVYKGIDAAKQRFTSLFNREPEFGAESVALSGLTGDQMVSRAESLLSPDEKYRRLMGEVEARTVQKRADLTAAERRQRHPRYDWGIPADQQIMR